MPRSKKAAFASRGGKNTRGTRGGRGGRNGNVTPQGRARATSGPSYMAQLGISAGFTLADEARQTSQHDHSFWGHNSNLRQKPVAFISAGTSDPLKLLDQLLEEDDSEPVESSHQEDLPRHRSKSPLLYNEKENTPEENRSDDDVELIGPEELENAIQSYTSPEENVAFFFDLTGDGTQPKSDMGPVHIPDRPSSRSSCSSEEVILFKGRDSQRKTRLFPEINMAQMRTEIQVVEEQIMTINHSATVTSSQGRNERRDKHKQRKKTKLPHKNDEDAILADYIENMRTNGDMDDIIGNSIGNRRELGGTDYAVSNESSDNNDSEELTDVGQEADSDEEGDAEKEDDSGEGDGVGSSSDIDNETLAKLIAGHRLDIGDNIHYGDLQDYSSSSSGEGNAKRSFIANDEFDLMDWERPSLRRRKKGKGARAQITFDVSDSELEQTLQAAWKNDRLKKSERKKQREQLRALGMLGKKANADDLRVKYPDGMNMDQVADEFRTFMLGSDETLAFPPMDNHARKMIHDLANKFKIKSKSTGKADQRRPTLHRTLRTLPYVESTFDQAVNKINRRYFPRLDSKGKRSQRAPPLRSSHTAATYRDGEVIGAAAPELGIDNRGRTMLEKMGWSSGTALGSINNKGILQPVTQTMKRSKAGLG